MCAAQGESLAGHLHGERIPRGGVCFIADVQYGNSTHRSDGKLDDDPEDRRFYSKTLATLVRSAREARHRGAASLVLLGDQVDDHDPQADSAAVEVLRRAEAEFVGCPVAFVLGNHDSKAALFQLARAHAPALIGHFAWECRVETEDGSPDWIMLVLDGWARGEKKQHGNIGLEQRRWLEERLLAARDAGRSVVLCSHAPLHSDNHLPGATRRARCSHDGYQVRKILAEAGNVRLCVAGHDHPGAYCSVDGTEYWTLPACLSVAEPPDLAGALLRLYRGCAELTPLDPGSGYVFDMETGDPDDVLALLFLCSKPSVKLRAVTISPGTQRQVQLVGWILKQIGLVGVRIGATDWPHNRNRKRPKLEDLFYRKFGKLEVEEVDAWCEPADQVLLKCCDWNVTLVTGGPLTNLSAALQFPGFRLGRWVAQGGFAGAGVVDFKLGCEGKFKAATCSTTNFGRERNHAEATKVALASRRISRRLCVSKNVCHRGQVSYTQEWHRVLTSLILDAEDCRLRALQLLHKVVCTETKDTSASAIELVTEEVDLVAFDELRSPIEARVPRAVPYTSGCDLRPGMWQLHDPLALAVALDESLVEFKEVELFHEGAENSLKWGSRLSPGSGTWISTDFGCPEEKFSERFRSILFAP